MKPSINLDDKFSQFSERWSPKIMAQMNDYHLKLVKFQGEFVWHDHKDTDEVFIVLDGKMVIRFRHHQSRTALEVQVAARYKTARW